MLALSSRGVLFASTSTTTSLDLDLACGAEPKVRLDLRDCVIEQINEQHGSINRDLASFISSHIPFLQRSGSVHPL
jgi:hypothetical protein